MNDTQFLGVLWGAVVVIGACITAYVHGYHLLATALLVPVGAFTAYTLYGAAHGAAIVARHIARDVRSVIGTATPPYRGEW